MHPDPKTLSQPPGDVVHPTTCYMCACRCGIKVHIKDGEARYIEGNRNHPVNRGVLCAKGSAGIMHQNSPARLTQPLRRVGERGKGEFEPISWDEALTAVGERLNAVRAEDPRKLAFFTGRDQSQALTGWWAKQFGTPNYAAHGGFCSVNMAAAGMYTLGGSFWEFSEPDWEHARYFMLFGVAEDHSSNPIKIGLGKLKERGAKFVSINPVQTGYSAIADEWLGITPGTDGLFIMALIHELLRAGRVDLDYLARYTDAAHLVIETEGADQGLYARGDGGDALVWDLDADAAVSAKAAGPRRALSGIRRFGDGREAKPVFAKLAERYLDPAFGPDAAARVTGIDAATIRRIAAELADTAFEQSIAIDEPWIDAAGARHERMIGRPVSIHAMRGISAHSNGFQTCRAIHVLQLLLGCVDVPGGMRFKPPYPKPLNALPRPAGRPDQVNPGEPMEGVHLGYPLGPEDLVVDAGGNPNRIDKAFSWQAPLAAHGMMHSVITNAYRGDPYPIDTLFMYMANMAWNSAMNTEETMAMLSEKAEGSDEYRIPFIIYSDAFASEMTAFADIVLPDTTYLERWDAISLLDRPISDPDGAADAIRQPVIEPDRDVRPFQDVLLELGVRLGLPGMVDDHGRALYPGGYSDYLINHERAPGVGTLAGWRGADGTSPAVGAPNAHQLQAYIDNGCFWREEIPANARYYKFANQHYLDFAVARKFLPNATPITMSLYAEPLQKLKLAARGHHADVKPPEAERDRAETFFDPLPTWYHSTTSEAADPRYPLAAITQRPMAMYHSWGSQNAWLRQIHGANRLFMHTDTAEQWGFAQDDWVWVVSPNGRVRAQLATMSGVNRDTLWTWNAIGKRAGAWNLSPNAPEARRGFLLNPLIPDSIESDTDGTTRAYADPITGQAAWFDLRVTLEPAPPPEPRDSDQANAGLAPPPDALSFGEQFKKVQ